MTSPVASQAGRLLRAIVPGLITLLLVVGTVIPLGVPFASAVTPLVVIMSVYYWSLYRPDLLPAAAVFGAGLLLDALTGGPAGLSALVLLLVQGMCLSQRRYIVGKPFLVEWTGFAIVALGAVIVGWLGASLFYGALIGVTPLVVQFFISIGLYPALARLFGRSEQVLLKAD